jgi:hypothetical protein
MSGNAGERLGEISNMRGTPTQPNPAPTFDHDTNRQSENSTTQSVDVSTHAELRWLQRARGIDRDLVSAWSKSRTLELARPCGFSEVRHDAQSDTLLCARDGNIVTVLYASHEPLQDPKGAETLHCAGCDRPRGSRHKKCSACGTLPVVEQQHTSQLFNGGNH